MESSCYGFTMVLVFLSFVVLSSISLPASSIVENLFSMFAIISSIRLYLSSPSSFIFSKVYFIHRILEAD